MNSQMLVTTTRTELLCVITQQAVILPKVKSLTIANAYLWDCRSDYIFLADMYFLFALSCKTVLPLSDMKKAMCKTSAHCHPTVRMVELH